MDSYSDWTHDFCLYCDTIATEGAYCSEACRVADFRQAVPLQHDILAHQQQQQQQRHGLDSSHTPPSLLPSPYALPSTYNTYSAASQSYHSSSRNSSLSSTPTTMTITSAPASMLSLPTYSSFAFSSPSSIPKTCPSSPSMHPAGPHLPSDYSASIHHHDTLVTWDVEQTWHRVPLNTYPPEKLDLQPSTLSTAPSFINRSTASNVQMLNVSSHLPQALRQELQRYDDAFDRSRRRRQSTMP